MQKSTLIKTGEKIRVATKQGIKSTRDVIALNVAGALDIYDDVEVGRSKVLVDDGKLGLRVVAKTMQLVNLKLKLKTTELSLNKKVLTSLTLKFLSQHLLNVIT